MWLRSHFECWYLRVWIQRVSVSKSFFLATWPKILEVPKSRYWWKCCWIGLKTKTSRGCSACEVWDSKSENIKRIAILAPSLLPLPHESSHGIPQLVSVVKFLSNRQARWISFFNLQLLFHNLIYPNQTMSILTRKKKSQTALWWWKCRILP
jgi:hypothetical protein